MQKKLAKSHKLNYALIKQTKLRGKIEVVDYVENVIHNGLEILLRDLDEWMI
jgi:hypothetical protein